MPLVVHGHQLLGIVAFRGNPKPEACWVGEPKESTWPQVFLEGMEVLE